MSTEENKNIKFLNGSEAIPDWIMAEARRLARQSPLERNFWMKKRAKELEIPLDELKALVEVEVEDIEKKAKEAKAEQIRQEKRADRQRQAAEDAEQRKREREEKKRERDQKQIEKEAAKKAKDKEKAFANVIRLPVEQHEIKLVELAIKLDLDLNELRDEFAELVEDDSREGISASPALWQVEPWPEPVTTAELLLALVNKINKHVAVQPHEALVIALWVLMTWVHKVAATHSVFLVSTSAEPEAGKSTLLEVLTYLTPRPAAGAEITAANLLRLVDRERPTLFVDEADDLFKLKSELTKIVNASWTPFTKIPKLVNIGGTWVTQWFSPFCPKAFGLIGLDLPRPLVGRSIVIKFWPKLPGAKVSFDHEDDEEFATIRRKAARWAADNGSALRSAKPLQPAGFDNRVADNWRLLLAIAELAGETWPQQARDAAERLARTRRKPSWRLSAMYTVANMAADGRKWVLSAELKAELLRDPTSPWHEYPGYRRVAKVTERQIADLLDALDIFPTRCGPKRLSGYLIADFAKAFTHFRVRSSHPLIAGRTRSKATRQRRKRGTQRR